jgi:K+-sensing histidine kinase KdpD
MPVTTPLGISCDGSLCFPSALFCRNYRSRSWPGVPEAELKEVFRPFHRLRGMHDRQSGGAGLGLAITARAVELHSGQVRAFNAQDGVIVEVRLLVQSV